MDTYDPAVRIASVAVRKTAATLADGRELISFDDSEPYVGGECTREPIRASRCDGTSGTAGPPGPR